MNLLKRAAASCGPVSLWLALRQTAHRPRLGALARSARLDEHGTTLLALKDAASAHGADARACRMNYAALAAARKPVVVHLRHGHFEVVEACDARWVRLAGPFRRRLSRDEFLTQWSGAALVMAAADGSLSATEETNA